MINLQTRELILKWKKEGKNQAEEEEKKLRFNSEKHILFEEAKKESSKIKPGEVLLMPLEVKEDFGRIFEEFQQAEEAFTLRKPGAGLGLPISKKFVELHGGQLWVESEVGRGSAFHFTLPIDAISPTTESIKDSAPIAEDEAANS